MFLFLCTPCVLRCSRYLPGAIPVCVFKNAGEVALVVKSDRTGDLRDRHAGRTEQGFAALDSQAVDIFGECTAQLVLDDTAKIGLGQIDLFGSLIQRQLFRQVFLDVGGGFEDDVLMLDIVQVKYQIDEAVQDRADPAVEGFLPGDAVDFLLIPAAQAQDFIRIAPPSIAARLINTSRSRMRALMTCWSLPAR